MRSLFGHCHYRRILTWLLAVVFLVTLVIVKSRNNVGSYLGRSGTKTQQPVATATVVNSNGETVVMLTGDLDGDGKLETVPEDMYITEDEKKEAAEQLQKMPWLKFPQCVSPKTLSLMSFHLISSQPRWVLPRPPNYCQQGQLSIRIPQQDRKGTSSFPGYERPHAHSSAI
jgi:hypothetical protein